MNKTVTGDENLLNVFLERNQGIHAGTDIFIYILKTTENKILEVENENIIILCKRI